MVGSIAGPFRKARLIHNVSGRGGAAPLQFPEIQVPARIPWLAALLLLPAHFVFAQVDDASDDPPPARGGGVRFENAGPVSTTEGHATLRWTLEEVEEGKGDAVRFEIQQSFDADFSSAEMRDPGRDRAMFVSGLPEGSNYFRVRAIDIEGEGAPGAWSEPVIVVVDYPDRNLVTGLFGVGLVVFIATVGSVIVGHLRHVRENEGN